MAIHRLIFLIMSLSLVCIILHLYLVEAAPQLSLVTSLPGFSGTFPSKHYSGYVTLDGDLPKKLFYYFVVSERNPSTDPLVLWLNGGPGCSSFDGFVYEHGPFNFEAAKEAGGLPVLHLNPYSWSKVANMIYLDTPAGVGLSYHVNKSVFYSPGDYTTAADNHLFLLKWFEQFPEFNSNPFYVAGESYAGIYVPTLVSDISKGIQSGIKPIINLKGYLVGNGVCDPWFDGNALVPFAHGMGLISHKMFREAEGICNGNYHHSNNTDCQKTLNKIYRVLDNLNTYDILEPCFHKTGQKGVANENTSVPQSFNQLGLTERPLAVRKRMFGRAWPFSAPVEDGIIPSWPQLMRKVVVPCLNDVLATIWLNNGAVREAIHASPESGDWSLCVDLHYNHDAGSMISHHKNLTASRYRVLIYSGDHDMCVPFTGTQAWTESLGYSIVDEWRPWTSNGQTAGFIQEYANDFIFLTVKGAGHTVPEYKPRESFDFFSRWLEGQKI